MGFRLMENFRQPYLAASIADFWRRWHISLSTWFRDYLYIPLGGNRYTEAIQREIGLSYEEAEEGKKGEQSGQTGAPSLSSVIDGINGEVASEIARTVDYFKTSTANAELNRVLVCGGVAKARGLIQQLGDRMQVPVEVADPFAEIDVSGCDLDPDQLADLAPSAAVSVGLALRAVGDR